MYEKSKMYYEKYKLGKFTKKVSSIIKDGNRYLTLINNQGKAIFVGGSVDDGETTKQAIVREIMEEIGAKVSKLKYLSKIYYSVDWEFEGVKFPNRRVEYIYLCEIIKDNIGVKGLQGEFDNNTTYKWCSIEELENYNLDKNILDLVKKIDKENIEI